MIITEQTDFSIDRFVDVQSGNVKLYKNKRIATAVNYDLNTAVSFFYKSIRQDVVLSYTLVLGITSDKPDVFNRNVTFLLDTLSSETGMANIIAREYVLFSKQVAQAKQDGSKEHLHKILVNGKYLWFYWIDAGLVFITLSGTDTDRHWIVRKIMKLFKRKFN